MKVDFHVHASERSGCAVNGEEEMIRAARAAGLDAIVFTDHHRLVPPMRLAELNERYAPFRIYGGVEMTTQEGEDCLVFGVQDPRLESSEWNYYELVTFVRGRGGFVVLAHPFRYAPEIRVDFDACPPDGIEVRSRNTPPAREADIREIAGKYGLVMLCNSDAHSVQSVGGFFNDVSELSDGDRQLVERLRMLKNG